MSIFVKKKLSIFALLSLVYNGQMCVFKYAHLRHQTTPHGE
jgi:hypothetical protein